MYLSGWIWSEAISLIRKTFSSTKFTLVELLLSMCKKKKSLWISFSKAVKWLLMAMSTLRGFSKAPELIKWHEWLAHSWHLCLNKPGNWAWGTERGRQSPQLSHPSDLVSTFFSAQLFMADHKAAYINALVIFIHWITLNYISRR